MEFHRFDRWDNPLGVLNDVLSAYHYQEAGGENSLTIQTKTPLSKGEHIVWCDSAGTWFEHIVDEPIDTRENGLPLCESYCHDALNEVFGDKVDEKRIRGDTSTKALQAVLEQTRWELGICTVTGTRTKSFYHCSVGESLQTIAETWNGEIYSSFAVGENGIAKRYVNFVSQVGSSNTHKRFEYQKDLANIKRTVLAGDVYTAMRGFGKGESVGEDEWGRRITFSDINKGKDYVEDAEALNTWGRPDGNGGKAHVFGTVIFEDCEDVNELKELTRQELNNSKEPKVSYECSVVDLKAMGFDYEGVAIGDNVVIIDSSFTPTLRATGRVMAMKRDLLSGQPAEITIGNIKPHIGSATASLANKLNAISRRSASWDVAAYTPSDYINQIINGLNREFDAGMSYVYQSPEQGLMVASVPLDQETGKPTTTPASAIQLKGGGFRIANEVNEDGTFLWRTFGTGDGFTADEITAGIIKGGSNWWNLNTGDLLFKQGTIADTAGRNTWNLTTGDLVTNRMTANNIIANGTFECGSTYGIKLDSTGKMVGYYGGKEIGFIDFSALAYDVNNPSTIYRGLQLQGDGIIRITTPRLSTANSNDISVTTTNGYTGTIKQPIVTKIEDKGNGAIGWSYGTFTLKFINGLLISVGTVS